MGIFQRAIDMAINEAKKSTHNQRVGAVIVKKKAILSKGHNYPCKSIKHFHPKFQKWKNSVHAEIDCIIKAKRNLAGTTMYVIRINSADQLRNSRPCKHCLAYIKHVGIKKVYYSINEYPYIAVENI